MTQIIRKIFIYSIIFLVALIGGLMAVRLYADQTGGFDKYGYNYKARIFVGRADGVDRNLNGLFNGYPKYANDELVMKWSKAWDDARFHGAAWQPGAWLINEWNGKVPGGTGEVWHYKIIWVGPEEQSSPYWVEGGEPIWDDKEIIFSQGINDLGHVWEVLAQPAGLIAK